MDTKTTMEARARLQFMQNSLTLLHIYSEAELNAVNTIWDAYCEAVGKLEEHRENKIDRMMTARMCEQEAPE